MTEYVKLDNVLRTIRSAMSAYEGEPLYNELFERLKYQVKISKPETVTDSIEIHMLKVKIAEHEQRLHHVKSTLLNAIANIRQAAEDQDYDEIISECDRFEVGT